MRRFLPLILILVIIGCSKAPDPVSLEIRFAERRAGKNLTAMKIKGSEEIFYLRKKLLLSEKDVASATVRNEGAGNIVRIEFTSRGKLKFKNLTKQNIGRHIGIVVNGELILAPIIRSEISVGWTVIEGNLTRRQAQNIAKGLSTLNT